ncbi:MAG: hypothetical protein QMB75_08465 [Thauera sp.]
MLKKIIVIESESIKGAASWPGKIAHESLVGRALVEGILCQYGEETADRYSPFQASALISAA